MQNHYGYVHKLKSDFSVVQAYANLETVVDDFEEAKLAASFLGIDDFGQNDAFIVCKNLLDPEMSISKKQATQFAKDLMRRLIKDPDKV